MFPRERLASSAGEVQADGEILMLRAKQRSIAMNKSKLTMRRSFACRALPALIFFAIAVTILTSAAAGESAAYRYTGQDRKSVV